ncbi:hypothetical protein N7G274_000618 [Stereocaulon virgatum]|uniref:Uncharacterized protein n=1 Tax=Stereocaulon virgatum TaxID=373712 RepID=A0ABR4APA5_9LECA
MSPLIATVPSSFGTAELKEQKAIRSKGHYGNAKILNRELLLERFASKEWDKEWFRLRILRPTIFEESRAASKRYQAAIALWKASLLGASPQELSPQEPSPQEPSPQEPSSQEPSPQELSLQEPSPQEPSPQNLSQPASKKPQLSPKTTQDRVEQAVLRAPRLIIRLPVRVTTHELKQGRWAMGVGKGALQEQKAGADPDTIRPLGRGQRVRKPRRAA